MYNIKKRQYIFNAFIGYIYMFLFLIFNVFTDNKIIHNYYFNKQSKDLERGFFSYVCKCKQNSAYGFRWEFVK